MSLEQDRIFFRNYSIVLGLLVVMIVIFFFLARFFGIDKEAYAAHRAKEIAERTKPVSEVRLVGDQEPVAAAAAAGAPAAGPAAAAEGGAEPSPGEVGKQVYSGLCFSCHGTGLPGIPQLGDAAAWSDRVAKGKELLYERALNGFTGTSGIMMPPKGGNPALSDEEVRAAVDYMVENSL